MRAYPPRVRSTGWCMIPFGDEQRIERIPVVIALLLIVMAITFLWEQGLSDFFNAQLMLSSGRN